MEKMKFVSRITSTNTKKTKKKIINIPEREWERMEGRFERPILVTLEEII